MNGTHYCGGKSICGGKSPMAPLSVSLSSNFQPAQLFTDVLMSDGQLHFMAKWCRMIRIVFLPTDHWGNTCASHFIKNKNFIRRPEEVRKIFFFLKPQQRAQSEWTELRSQLWYAEVITTHTHLKLQTVLWLILLNYESLLTMWPLI